MSSPSIVIFPASLKLEIRKNSRREEVSSKLVCVDSHVPGEACWEKRIKQRKVKTVSSINKHGLHDEIVCIDGYIPPGSLSSRSAVSQKRRTSN